MASSERDRVADVLWSLVVVAILLVGVAGFLVMGALRTPLAADPVERTVPRVETMPLERFDAPVPVRAEGFVTARRRVSLAAASPGRVEALHPAMLELGQVREGDRLVRLDDRSARATLARADADIAATQARIELNASQLARTEALRRRGVVSQEELDQRLARQAELAGGLASLESARRGAEIALENSVVSAPFDGAVLARSVELGSVVSTGQPLAELFTADALEVVVPLTERAASLVPGLFGPAAGRATATVTTAFAGREQRRPARVVRVARGLGTGTRMLDVTVALSADRSADSSADSMANRSVDHSANGTPDGRAREASGRSTDGVRPGDPPAGRAPTLLDTYAQVVIDGASLEAVYAVPSAAIRPDSTVWLVVGDLFRIRAADIVLVDGGTSYVRVDAADAEAVLVTGVVDTPVDGMRVQTGNARAAPDGASIDD